MFAQQLARVHRQLRDQSIDCLALVPGPNLQYLTGTPMHLQERVFVVLIPAEAEPVLVMPELEVPTWRQAVPSGVRMFTWDDAEGPQEAMRSAAATLPRIGTLAVEDHRMRVQEFQLLGHHLPLAEIVPAEPVMGPLRMRKDPKEISAIRRAIQISERALESVIAGFRPGDTERELAGRLTRTLLEMGGETVPIDPAVLAGPRSALPHGASGHRPVLPGDILLIDFVTTVGGYFSDITRTFAVGRPPDDRMQEIYGVVREANAAARAAVRPGVTCHEVDTAARQVITAAGYGPYFFHRTGHGLGLDVHEAPPVAQGNALPLQAGTVFTVEPGIYVEGWGGVRIEDNVVVTADGCETLTSFSRDLRVIGA